MPDRAIYDIGWTDLCREATAIPLQGQQGDPTRDADGGLLFGGASETQQIAVLYQIPHEWIGSPMHPHIHWQKTTDDAGGVIWELRHRIWNIHDIVPEWSEWATIEGRSMELGESQHTLIDRWALLDMAGIHESAMISIQLRRVPTDAGDTYAEDAKLWDIDLHYQRFGSGTVTEWPVP